MSKKRLIISCLLALLACIVLAGYILPWEKAGAQPQKALLKNNGGPVVFEHEKHASAAKECIVCHHELRVSEKAMKCDSCHGITVDDAFRAEHAKSYPGSACAVCHHYRTEEGRNCALCHEDYKTAGKDWGHSIHVTKYKLVCTTCHHKEYEPKNCAACHQDGKAPLAADVKKLGRLSFSDAVHKKCSACHISWFTKKKQESCDMCHAGKHLGDNGARMHENANFVHCSSCHTGVESVQKLIPGSMQALHMRCMGCHAEKGVGPYTKEDCSKCHLK